MHLNGVKPIKVLVLGSLDISFKMPTQAAHPNQMTDVPLTVVVVFIL